MRKLLGVILVALFFVVGCKQPQPFGGVPRTKTYLNVVSLSPSTTELMCQFVVNVIGRSKSCNYPPPITAKPVVADLKPDYEAIVRLKPDLITYDKNLYSDAEVAKIKALGIDTLAVGSDTVTDFVRECYIIGNKVGGEGAVTEYVEKINRQRQASEGEKPSPAVTAALIIPDATGHHMIAGVKSFQADLVKIMGATPIGPDSSRFEMMNAEYLISQNPDVIIVAGELKSFNDPRFANLKAVKTHHMFGLPQDYVLRRGCRVDQTIYEGHKSLMLVTRGK